MKKIIFFIIAAVFAAQVGAQTIKYRTLEECNNDPLLYIEYNYIHHATEHVNQYMYEFGQQFELPVSVEQITPITHEAWEGADQSFDGNIEGFFLKFYYEVGDSDVMYSIGIEFNPPYVHNWNDSSSPFYRMLDEEVPWYDIYDNYFWSSTIKQIWVNKKKDGKWVTDTYDHFRDHYKVSENLHESWINE